MPSLKRYHLLLAVLPVVALVVAAKLAVHAAHLEFLTLDGIIPSIVAGAIFLIGFLLSHVMSDFKEAERIIGEMRVALESIHSDIASFATGAPDVDMPRVRRFMIDFVGLFETCLGRAHAHSDLTPVIGKAEELTSIFADLERRQMSGRYVVRLRSAHDVIRLALYRIAYIQRMEFSPSAHVMVQTLVISCLFLMLLLKTPDITEGALVIGFVSYMFVYAMFLVGHLEKPFRKGEATVDDVSIFLLRDFATKLEREAATTRGA